VPQQPSRPPRSAASALLLWTLVGSGPAHGYTCDSVDGAGCPAPGTTCYLACNESDVRQALALVNACPTNTTRLPITMRMGPDAATTCGSMPIALAMAPTAPAVAPGSCGDDNASRYNALCLRNRDVVFDGRGAIFTYAGDHVCASCAGECTLCPGGQCASRQPAMFVVRGAGNTLRDFEMRFFPEGIHLRDGDGHRIVEVTSRYVCEEAFTVEAGTDHRLERNVVVGNTAAAAGGGVCFRRVEGSACTTDADCGAARCYCGLLSQLGACAAPPPPPLWPAGAPGQCFAPAPCGLDKAIQVNGGSSTIGGDTPTEGNRLHDIGQPVHVVAGTHAVASNVSCGHRTNANLCQAYDVSGGAVTMRANRIDACKFGIRLVDGAQVDAVDNVLTNNHVSAFQVKGAGPARLRAARNRMRNNGHATSSDCQRGALVVRGNAQAEIDFGGGNPLGAPVLGGAVSAGDNVFCQASSGGGIPHVWNVTDCPCAAPTACACTFTGPAGGSCGTGCPLSSPCCALEADGACAGSLGGGASVGIGATDGPGNLFHPLPTFAPSPAPTVVDRAPAQTRVENAAAFAACDTIVVDECECRSRPDGTPCNDGNLCTATDVCLAGACIGTAPTVCPSIGSCREPGVCAPTTGLCTPPHAPDGTACDETVLDVSRLAMRRRLARGSVTLRATFFAGTPPDATAGVSLRVQDAGGTDVQQDWPAERCRGAGGGTRIVCSEAGGARVLRLGLRPGGPHRLRVALGRLAVAPPFVPGVTVTLSHAGRDRVGTLDTGWCRTTASGLRCRRP
jgi:hypothetical protein